MHCMAVEWSNFCVWLTLHLAAELTVECAADLLSSGTVVQPVGFWSRLNVSLIRVIKWSSESKNAWLCLFTHRLVAQLRANVAWLIRLGRNSHSPTHLLLTLYSLSIGAGNQCWHGPSTKSLNRLRFGCGQSYNLRCATEFCCKSHHLSMQCDCMA